MSDKDMDKDKDKSKESKTKGLDLKALRERLQMTQADLASSLDVTQEYISRLEKQPENMPLDVFMALCQLANMMPNELLNSFTLAKPKALSFADVYDQSNKNSAALIQYLENSEARDQEAAHIRDLIAQIKLYRSKPLVGFLGPSDAGKSTLINTISGIDLLLSQWTPTTAAAVYLKHVQDKPAWMGDDQVCIFRAESKDKSWNFRNIDNESYCRSLAIESGDADLLKKYCNRSESQLYKEVDAAVVFADSDILKVCDLVDLPGFGTEEFEDTLRSQRAREQLDVVIFLCQSNGFFSKQTDVLFMKDTIQHLPIVNTEQMPLLSNLLVVASQAHIVKDGLKQVLDRGASVVSQQLSEEVVEQYFEVDKSYFDLRLRDRFYSYSLDSGPLRASFEQELSRMLTEVLPPLRIGKLNEAVAAAAKSLGQSFEDQIKRIELVMHSREQAKQDYEEAIRNKPVKYAEIRKMMDQLVVFIDKTNKNNVLELKLWEKEHVTEQNIVEIINKKNYDKKQAKEYLVSNVADLYFAKMQEVLKPATMELSEMLTKFFEGVNRSADDIGKMSVEGVTIPFDFKGALAGGIAGATVLGGLGLWASTVGNLGGYILVAKGVSLLSAIGISVGGTAAAASFVALIGGPITIGIALALGVFAAVKFLFGDSWKKSFARNIAKTMEKEQVLNNYIQVIDKFWSDTKIALEEVVESIIQSLDDHLNQLQSLIETFDSEQLEAERDYYARLKKFIAALLRETDNKQPEE